MSCRNSKTSPIASMANPEVDLKQCFDPFPPVILQSKLPLCRVSFSEETCSTKPGRYGATAFAEGMNMPLSDIDADWLDTMLFNGAEHPIYGSIDVGSELLAIEAMDEAPEASRHWIATAIETAAPDLIREIRGQKMPDHVIAEVQETIRRAVLALRSDWDLRRWAAWP